MVVQPNAQMRRLCLLLTVSLTVALLFLGSRPGAGNFIPPVPWDKLAHLVVYGGFGALAWIVFASKSLIWPVFMVAIIGFMDETMQYFTPGRSADVLDLVADISGAVLAVLLLRLIQRLFFRATRA